MSDISDEADFGVAMMAPCHRRLADSEPVENRDEQQFGIESPVKDSLPFENDIGSVFCIHFEAAGKVGDFVPYKKIREQRKTPPEKYSVKRLAAFNAGRPRFSLPDDDVIIAGFH